MTFLNTRTTLVLATAITITLAGCATTQGKPGQETDNAETRTEAPQTQANQNTKGMWIWVSPGYRDSLAREDQSYTLRPVPQ